MSIARNGQPGRPSVSVVMPFVGSRTEAWAAIETLGGLDVLDGDELLLADNAGVLAGAGGGSIEVRAATGVSVAIARASGERSPARARNVGAAAAHEAEWILFLDADTVAPRGLLDRYFAKPIADDVGAVAGGITAVALGQPAGIAARYGAHKNFLDAGAHLAHPFMPRAAAANLLVRRAAFDAVGGFFEGLRAAEDTDFSWRLQLAGWRLLAAPGAVVEHRYRDSLPALRRQWRGYAAGRAWLGRRYDGFAPQPALVRAARRGLARVGGRSSARDAAAMRESPATPETWDPPARPVTSDPGATPVTSDPGATPATSDPPATPATRDPPAGTAPPDSTASRLGDNDRMARAISQSGFAAGNDRVPFALLDALLGVEEVIGFTLSNRPPAARSGGPRARRVVVADRFPDGQAESSAAAGPVRIEAGRRADRAAPPVPGVTIVYREDDGPLDRARAMALLIARRPDRVLATTAARNDRAPSPMALAPAARRLRAEPDVTLSPSSTDPVVLATAWRLGRLAGRALSMRTGPVRQAPSSDRAAAADDGEENPRR